MARQRGVPLEFLGDVTEMGVFLVGSEHGVEVLRPQVVVSDLVAPGRKFIEYDIAQMRDE
jgi:hypothetical protein